MLEIPARSTVFIGMDGASVTLTNLSQPLTTGQYLELTFEFKNAGRVTLPVTVATPNRPLDRGETFDFHPTEGG
jgi:copper(I)-binding protein